MKPLAREGHYLLQIRQRHERTRSHLGVIQLYTSAVMCPCRAIVWPNDSLKSGCLHIKDPPPSSTADRKPRALFSGIEVQMQSSVSDCTVKNYVDWASKTDFQYQWRKFCKTENKEETTDFHSGVHPFTVVMLYYNVERVFQELGQLPLLLWSYFCQSTSNRISYRGTAVKNSSLLNVWKPVKSKYQSTLSANVLATGGVVFCYCPSVSLRLSERLTASVC